MRIEAEPAYRTKHANPYNAALYDAMQLQGAEVRDLSYLRLAVRPPDVVHLHWPELTFLSGHRRWRIFARLFFFFAMLRLARRHGTKLIWTVHNPVAHEQRATPALRRMYRKLLMRNVDAVLALSEQGLIAVRESYPELADRQGFVTPHGHYRAQYDLTAPKPDARRRQGLPTGPLLGCIGQIRPYKNVPALIVAHSEAREAGYPGRLVVAGRPSDAALRQELERAAAGDATTELRLEFLDDATLTDLIRAADLVVLPYRAIQNSGSALLALSAGRPVLVPDQGAMRELQTAVGEHWVRLFEGPIDAVTLADAERWALRPRGDDPDLTAFEWDAIAKRTLASFQTVLGCAEST